MKIFWNSCWILENYWCEILTYFAELIIWVLETYKKTSRWIVMIFLIFPSRVCTCSMYVIWLPDTSWWLLLGGDSLYRREALFFALGWCLSLLFPFKLFSHWLYMVIEILSSKICVGFSFWNVNLTYCWNLMLTIVFLVKFQILAILKLPDWKKKVFCWMRKRDWNRPYASWAARELTAITTSQA